MKMLFFELDKTVIKNKNILLIMLVMLIKLITLDTEVYAINPFTYENRAQFLPIVNTYSGKVTQEVSAAIEKQYTAVTQAQVNMTALRQKYNRGEIAQTEYITQSTELEKLVNEEDLFLTFYSQYTYVQEKPDERYLLYDDGWNALLAQERFDWGFVLLTIVLAASVFGREYETDMRTIVIATKKGDGRLIAAKLVSIFATVILCSLLASLVEYLFFSLKFGLPHGDYPLQSLFYFKDSAFHLSLLQTYICISAYRMLGLLMLATVTMLISVLSKKTILTLSASLMYVILPYAIPVGTSTRYLLPSPIGFILAQGFFRGTQMGENYQANEVLFNSISQSTQIWLVVGWLILFGVMLYMIARKFLPIRRFSHFTIKVVTVLFSLVFITTVSACSLSSTSSQLLVRSYNMTADWNFTVVGKEVFTLYPTFLMENIQTHEIAGVIRDPFSDEDTINKTVSAIFNRNGKLDYLVKTDDELQVVELDISTYKTSILYEEHSPKNPALINSDLEAHQWSEGKAGIFFFIDGNNIYISSGTNLRRVNAGTKSDETILKNIYPGHVAFNGKKIYYITTAYEINIYDIASGENEPISDIRTDFFYLRGSKIYYRNLDKDGMIYMYNAATQQNELVTKNHTDNFACDDEYIYYHNQDDQNYLYRTNLQTGFSELMAPIANGYEIQVMDGYPYLYDYIYGADLSSETYRLDKQTLKYEMIDYQSAK